jgi:carboxypeptidase family protein
MLNAQNQLGNLRIAAPCQASWEGMAGDARVRHCTLCSLNVYNFAEMTREEVAELLARTEGRVCARLYRRADGTVLTRDCPTGLRALRRRASRVAAAWITALLSFPSLAFGGTICRKPRMKTRGSRVRIEIERVATPRPAVLGGVVRDEGGAPIPGASIAVRDEVSDRELTAVTDPQGAFTIASLEDGVYRVDVTLAGFKPASIEHLQLKAGEVTNARVALRLDPTMLMGAVVVVEMETTTTGISTTFSQDFINKLPF